jgi:serine/threonine-protein kinase
VEAFAGRYRLIDLIGTGGMGSVWRAWDLRRSKYVAAKVLGQHDAATLLRFVREQSLRIQHPHVVAPHGWAADDDKVVFAMDLVRGGSVATLLGDHGPLPASYVAVLLDQLLHGLSAVHAAQVVHRDVKPANLLLDVTGTGRPYLRLSDFGVAGLLDEPRMTRHSTILGTPGYLAPEQLAGADPDPRQDLYAVGVVAAELLTGERPNPDSQPANPGGPLAEFIAHLTAPDPSNRPNSATTAGRLLATTNTLPPAAATAPELNGLEPWVNTPDAPEVFDQLPPLPPNWTPSGPRPTPPPAEVVGDGIGVASQQVMPPLKQEHVPLAVTERAGPAGQEVPQAAAPGTPQPAAQDVRGAAVPAQAGRRPQTDGAPGGGQNRVGGSSAAGGVGPARGAGQAGRSGQGGESGRVRRGLWVGVVVCFVGAVGLLGSAAWFLFR